jgi:hypothetical protein
MSEDMLDASAVLLPLWTPSPNGVREKNTRVFFFYRFSRSKVKSMVDAEEVAKDFVRMMGDVPHFAFTANEPWQDGEVESILVVLGVQCTRPGRIDPAMWEIHRVEPEVWPWEAWDDKWDQWVQEDAVTISTDILWDALLGYDARPVQTYQNEVNLHDGRKAGDEGWCLDRIMRRIHLLETKQQAQQDVVVDQNRKALVSMCHRRR